MSKLRLHRVLYSTRAEGPGLRSVLWVQGCSRHCPGCAVPWTWDPNEGTLYGTGGLAEKILAVSEIEGITYLGGEPFEQAAALAVLAEKLREAGLSVLTFTGFLLEELREADRPDWNALLATTDLLIDGPFERDKLSMARPWVGSSNQRFHFLTPRYADLRDRLARLPNRVEVRLAHDGSVEMNGMAAPEIWAGLAALLRGDPDISVDKEPQAQAYSPKLGG